MFFAITGVACGATPQTEPGITVTGRLLSVNGETEVPRGLFGVHATPLTADEVAELGVESVRTIDHNPGKPKRAESSKCLPPGITHIVECFYDRYQPALIVTRADWQAELERVAEQYGEAAKALDRQPIVEFWNEPYLNWGVRPGVNYDGAFYKGAGRAIGAPMTLKHADSPTEYLVWTKQLVAVPARGGPTHYLATRYKPDDRQAGETFTWRGDAYRLDNRWWGRDVTQETFWPGKQNSLWYRQMLLPFATKLKAINSDVTLVAGWGFHIHQNGWAAWEDVHQPTIDETIEWIDGYNEHHYGGDTRMVAGAYETVSAYTAGKHGKVLDFYNTEAGGELDAEQPGQARPGYNVLPKAQRDRGAMTYMLRDIIHLIDVCPDKAVARAAHEAGGKGHRAAFTLLKPLRGRLLEVNSPDRQVWAVGSLDDRRLGLVLFNDSLETVEHPVRVAPPTGLTLDGGVLRTIDEDLNIVEKPIEATGGRYVGRASVPGRSAVSLVFDLAGEVDPAAPTVAIEQFYCPEILVHVPPGESVEMAVELADDVDPAALDGATLRLIQHGLGPATQVELNGRPLAARPIAGWTHDEPIDPTWLKRHNIIRIAQPADAGDGVAVNATSLRVSRLSERSPR